MTALSRFSTAVELLSARIASARRGHTLHPAGMRLDGVITVQDNSLLPTGTWPVTARLSKAFGTPGGTPDILGLAICFGSPRSDITLSSCGSGSFTRFLVKPVRSWRRALLGSIAAYYQQGRYLWLYATISTDARDASIEAVTARLPIEITLACGTSPVKARRIAVISLDRIAEHLPHVFDPMRHRPADATMAPGWLYTLRNAAYRGSRTGRTGAASDD
ncbi:hypothetical protein LFM09_44525 [Lentzea alba]|uniref:hypothetical protein n=1 Tax=Lentzea alba TaxID=2714351 RepID=UPI0039BF12AA